MSATRNKFSPEFRDRALRMVESVVSPASGGKYNDYK
jgi:hypothetical protein